MKFVTELEMFSVLKFWFFPFVEIEIMELLRRWNDAGPDNDEWKIKSGKQSEKTSEKFLS